MCNFPKLSFSSSNLTKILLLVIFNLTLPYIYLIFRDFRRGSLCTYNTLPRCSESILDLSPCHFLNSLTGINLGGRRRFPRGIAFDGDSASNLSCRETSGLWLSILGTQSIPYKSCTFFISATVLHYPSLFLSSFLPHAYSVEIRIARWQ